MKVSDINIDVVAVVIGDLGDEFYTKDVSEDIYMTRCHSHLVNEFAYHSVVGRVIGANTSDLHIQEISKDNPRGSLWRKY
ncbi:MAG: hypothetical protein MUO40_12690 [Anaerolineaceae bacterium]|nr:hypothetical protein [Anaerolineaceae bacterium]